MTTTATQNANVMNALNVYQLHFGVEERRQRKRHHAARLLRLWKGLGDLRSIHDTMAATPAHRWSAVQAMSIFSKILKLRESGIKVPQWMHVCYRNHVYPVEVRGWDAPFRDVDMRHVDALLLDRPYDKFGTHFSSRQPWSQQDYGWIHAG